MIIPKKYTTESGDKRVFTYSDKNMKITRDEEIWDTADDFEWQNRVYEETDIPIETEPQDETEQKAEAYDYLTGRSAPNE